MPLDPQVAAYLASLPTEDSPTLPIEELRRQNRLAGLVSGGEPIPLAQVHDRVIAGPGVDIPIRIYRPTADEATLPALLYFHGGGWVLGTIDTHDNVCRALAKHTPCVVISVDYRLAPEHKYPAAIEDAEAALLWTIEHAGELHIDALRLAVGGDSAGGNVAAALTLIAREKGYPRLAAQLLIYPVTDHYSSNHASYAELATGYGLTRKDMQWFWDQYLTTPEDGNQPYAAPLRASDLSQLPPALVVIPEYDPLRDEGRLYAQRLSESNVPTKLLPYAGMIHSFFRMNGIFERTAQAQKEVATELHTLLYSQE
ncbi:alpha/beta hydrolase [Ktedonospora formicarum]|uniref:Acetylhydrolase n=1 Tax=Ktedonospora formicarum TaxID=2778364 RepID=A0A8J3HZP5_9CHLR|nr:alpha/beta hydrolase [Ktedonospora formicarum]GHO43458.1 acetylhydrolase [Ktedonospora formicarum]